MRILAKKAFREAVRLIRAIEADQADLGSVQRLNLLVLRQVLASERAILRHRESQRKLNKELKTGRGSKEAANAIRRKLASVARYIAAREDQIFIWKCFGDALAYVYLDKFSVKHAYFETDRWGTKDRVGMLTGKQGLENEVAALTDLIGRGIPAVLCDLTNVLRYGDVCLLGASDPYLIEVKSSPKLNKRGKRQLEKLGKLLDFLATDEAVDFRGGKGPTKRVNLAIPERNYVAQLNECITRATEQGNCIYSPEPGLIYLAAYDLPDVDTFTGSIGKAPLLFMLNGDKNDHCWAPYLPFILTIRKPDHLIDFIEGRLSLAVAIDTDILCQLMAREGWSIRFRSGDDYALQCLHEQTRAYFGLSQQFVSRAGYEFVSLEWMAEAQWSNVEQMQIADNTSDQPVDPKAHERRLVEMFGPDDEWTKDMVV